MDDERWDDLNNFKTCPLCGTESALFVDILEEANKDAEQLFLQAEYKRTLTHLRDLLAVIHCDGGHTTEGIGIEKSVNKAIDVRNQQVIKLEKLQAENERLRDTISHYMDCKCHVISNPPCAKCVALEGEERMRDGR